MDDVKGFCGTIGCQKGYQWIQFFVEDIIGMVWSGSDTHPGQRAMFLSDHFWLNLEKVETLKQVTKKKFGKAQATRIQNEDRF